MGKLPTFTQQEVARITGASKVALQNWTNRGWIRLERDDWGKGKKKQYSFDDLFSVRGLVSLSKLGLSPNITKDILDVIEERGRKLLIGKAIREVRITGFAPGQMNYLFIQPEGGMWAISETTTDKCSELEIDTSAMSDSFIVIQLDLLLHRVIERAFALRPYFEWHEKNGNTSPLADRGEQ